MLVLKIYKNPSFSHSIGDKLDSLNGVYVYYNGRVGHVGERNVSADGYNIGIRYQCVEFVKRYYYEFYKHKMPNSYGNAKDFFDAKIADGELNTDRNLLQFKNGSKSKPQMGDLVIFDGHAGNPYGHVAIVSQVKENELEIIQQNPGVAASSRVWFTISYSNNLFAFEHERCLGWLRIKNN